MNSQFGNCLFKIACLKNVKNIFEVGSWNGEGSTVCLMNGVILNESCKLYSVEADTTNFKKSKEFWGKYETNNKLELLNGTLHNNISDINQLNILFGNNIPVFKEHYVPEKILVETSPLLNIDHIHTLDFIVLDGGEYTTQSDFDILFLKNPTYIALDDVNVFKCKSIRQTMLENVEWELYEENLNDRNGWSIFKKKSSA